MRSCPLPWHNLTSQCQKSNLYPLPSLPLPAKPTPCTWLPPSRGTSFAGGETRCITEDPVIQFPAAISQVKAAVVLYVFHHSFPNETFFNDGSFPLLTLLLLRKPPKSSSSHGHHIRQAVFIDECRQPENEPDDDDHHHHLHHWRTHAPNLKVNFLDASLALLALCLGIRRLARYIIRGYKKSKTSQRDSRSIWFPLSWFNPDQWPRKRSARRLHCRAFIFFCSRKRAPLESLNSLNSPASRKLSSFNWQFIF